MYCREVQLIARSAKLGAKQSWENSFFLVHRRRNYTILSSVVNVVRFSEHFLNANSWDNIACIRYRHLRYSKDNRYQTLHYICIQWKSDKQWITGDFLWNKLWKRLRIAEMFGIGSSISIQWIADIGQGNYIISRFVWNVHLRAHMPQNLLWFFEMEFTSEAYRE